jgi:signal peptidase II
MKNNKFIWLFVGLLILDQATKFLFFGKEINLIGELLRIDSSMNTGIAFGMMQGMNLVWIIVSIIAGILIWIYFKKYPICVALIEVGIIGNLIDRIYFGYVRDFIGMYIWPNFNIADACNTIGILILVYYLWKEDHSI